MDELRYLSWKSDFEAMRVLLAALEDVARDPFMRMLDRSVQDAVTLALQDAYNYIIASAEKA